MALPVTDIPRGGQENRRVYRLSDALRTIPVPPGAELRRLSQLLENSLETEDMAGIRDICRSLVECVCSFYAVPAPALRVLGKRPRAVRKVALGESIREIHGDYSPSTREIRVWMRTAVRGRIVAFKTLLDTIIHEVCHHLDFTLQGWTASPHTRGFYERAGRIYAVSLSRPYTEPVWRRISRGRFLLNYHAMKKPATFPGRAGSDDRMDI